MKFFTGLIIGLILGGIIGTFTMALCTASKDTNYGCNKQ